MLDIYTNNYSYIAQTNLVKATSAQAKSIERLSSGLRINHASDDASGLALSDKLRAQIGSLARASMNAQDAISYLQTAQNGLDVISDMLNRMKDLAIQAGNSAYTSNDRREMQIEVDHIKNEINRISSSTEYNTKKLLTGSSLALWSSNSSEIDAIIRGAVAEGNYRLDITINPGQNAIYRSETMNMKEPGYDVKYFGVGAPAVSSVKYLSGNVRTTFALTNANTPSTTSAETATVYANNSAGKTSSSFGTEISNASHADLFDMYKAAYSAGDIIKDSGYVVIEFLESIAISAGGSFGQQKAYATFYNAASGNPVFSNEFDLVSGANTIEVGGNRFTLNVDTIDDRAYTAGSKLGITLQKGGIAANNWVELSDYGNTEYLSVAVDISTHNPGKFFVYALGYFSAGATSGMVELAGFEFDTHAALPTGVNISINVNPYNIAKENTRLADISLFTNGDGRMILANNQELQIYGNGNRTSIYLDGYDTIASLRDKLTSAIIDLGMGANAINNNLVKYFSSATSTTGGNGGVPGTFIIQTALLGANSELHFAGDEHLVNAMSLLTVQSSAQSQTSVSVFDAHSGRYIGSGAVYDNMLRGVIKGVDVKINSQTGYNAKWNYTNNQVSFSSIGKPQSVWLNLTDNQAEVQVGSNEGQKVNISVVRIDTAALEIDDVNVVTMPLAAKAIAKIDMALDRVSFERTDLGAKVNRLEYAMKNLSSSKINLIEAESRIRNVDIASESATFARNQILMDASIAMLAQANAIPYKALQLIRG